MQRRLQNKPTGSQEAKCHLPQRKNRHLVDRLLLCGWHSAAPPTWALFSRADKPLGRWACSGCWGTRPESTFRSEDLPPAAGRCCQGSLSLSKDCPWLKKRCLTPPLTVCEGEQSLALSPPFRTSGKGNPSFRAPPGIGQSLRYNCLRTVKPVPLPTPADLAPQQVLA